MLIFINYKQNVDPDHKLARLIEKWLKSSRHEVFRDEGGIRPGQKWAERIRQQVEKCDVMLSLISNQSLRSPWVLNEIDLANRLGKHIIPVLLQELDEDLEFEEYSPRFMGIQHYRMTGNDKKDRHEILDAIAVPV